MRRTAQVATITCDLGGSVGAFFTNQEQLPVMACGLIHFYHGLFESYTPMKSQHRLLSRIKQQEAW